MKFNLKYIIVVSALIGMAGCDDKIEPFEIMLSLPFVLELLFPVRFSPFARLLSSVYQKIGDLPIPGTEEIDR